MIDASGKAIVRPNYDRVGSTSPTLVNVQRNGKWGVYQVIAE